MTTQEFYNNTYKGTTPTDGVDGVDTISSNTLPSSYPSKPVTQIDIPEISMLEASFSYVYFMPDEKTNQSSSQVNISINETTRDELEFLASTDRVPRFVRVTFSPPSFNTLDSNQGGNLSSDAMNTIFENVKVSEHINDIMFEDAISNTTFSSVNLIDTGIDRKFYTSLSSSLGLSGTPSQPAQMASTVTAVNPYSIRSILNNLQSKGVTFSRTDIRESVISDPLLHVRSLQFDFNVNNLIFGTIISGSIDDNINVYSDELSGILQSAKFVQDATVNSANPTTVSEADYEPVVIPIDQEIVEASSQGGTNANEGSVLIGFLIKKFEINNDGTLSQMRSIPVDSPDITSVIDNEVRYGGAYLYKVHAVSLSRFEARRISTATADQVVLASTLIASSGISTTVICKEDIPPSPPVDIRFKYDYKYGGLVVFWEFPINPQRDIKRFQIFRRPDVKQPFTLIREYNFDNSTSITIPLEHAPGALSQRMKHPKKMFRDSQFTKNSRFIYTISSIDARGLSSNYAMQFEVSFDKMKNKLSTRLLSKSGAPKPYPNLYLDGDVFTDTIKDSGHERIKLYFDPEFLKLHKNRLVETQSGGIEKISEDLSLIRGLNDPEPAHPAYKLQILNTDLQSAKIVDIYLGDISTEPQAISESSANVSTLAILNSSGQGG